MLKLLDPRIAADPVVAVEAGFALGGVRSAVGAASSDMALARSICQVVDAVEVDDVVLEVDEHGNG